MCRIIHSIITKLKRTSDTERRLDVITDDQGKYWYELDGKPDSRQGPFTDEYEMSLHLKKALLGKDENE